MVWGTALLFIDCILIILIYEQSRACLTIASSRAWRWPARWC